MPRFRPGWKNRMTEAVDSIAETIEAHEAAAHELDAGVVRDQAEAGGG